MVRANCRERFTAADFDFVVRTLARSQIDHVSLVDLLSDQETRDAVLDNPRLVDAILCNAGHLSISSHFYFYVLARHVLRQAGINDRKFCDYVASLLETFSRMNGICARRTWPTNAAAIHLRHADRADARNAGAGFSSPRARGQLLAFYQRNLSREHAAPQPARRART